WHGLRHLLGLPVRLPEHAAPVPLVRWLAAAPARRRAEGERVRGRGAVRGHRQVRPTGGIQPGEGDTNQIGRERRKGPRDYPEGLFSIVCHSRPSGGPQAARPCERRTLTRGWLY